MDAAIVHSREQWAHHRRPPPLLRLISIPTGLGKTAAVVLAWLWNRFVRPPQPSALKLRLDLNRALSLLCERLGYFGRAESLVEARLVTARTDFQPNARPLPPNEPVPEGCELVRLLCPLSAEQYAAWQATQTPVPAAVAAKGSRKKPSTSVAPHVPVDLFEALHADTGDLQRAGWTLPPGSQFLDYVRPAHCFDLAPARPRRRTGPLPTIARFAVSSALLPRLTRAVSVAERIHQALVKYSDQAPVFTGKAGGQLLQGHQHAFILCEATPLSPYCPPA